MEDLKQLLLQYSEFEKNIVFKNRYEQCAFCENLQNEGNSPFCGKCGCNLLLKIIDEESCPIGKW